MKKIVVMSDNHGQYNHIYQVLEDNRDADLFIHCGDNEGYDDQLEAFVAVKGNNDWSSSLNRYEFVQVDHYRIAITHGDQFGYFNKEDNMIEFAIENEIDIILSGHTHMPMAKQVQGVYMINPGSTALPRGGSPASYAIIYVDKKKIDVEFIAM